MYMIIGESYIRKKNAYNDISSNSNHDWQYVAEGNKRKYHD